MEVNKLEGREVTLYLFGLPIMVTIIVLVSMIAGHLITTRSDRPTNVTVSAATPKIEVNVPQGPAPRIEVTAATPKVDVTVPTPTVNVTTPPATVTVLDKREGAKDIPATPAKVENRPEPAKSDIPKKESQPTVVPTAPSVITPGTKSSSSANIKDEDLTLETLYAYADKYIESYCSKKSLDQSAENKRWLTKYLQNMNQSIVDGTDTDEQTYINRIVVEKRNCFDIEKASPEQIVEGCRIMLRYRDGKLAWLKAMRDAVTNENLKKTLVFLAAGVR